MNEKDGSIQRRNNYSTGGFFLLIIIVGSAGYNIYKKKKSGTKCIGFLCVNACCGGCKQKKADKYVNM